MSLIKIITFNNTLKEMISFLKKTFPSEKKFIEYKCKIDMVIDAKPTFIIDNFKYNVLNYKEKILNRDENFLLIELNKIYSNNQEFLDFNSVWNKKENTKEIKTKIFNYMIKLINTL